MENKHWSDKLQTFKNLKRKSAHLEEIIALADLMVSKIESLTKEKNTLQEASEKEITLLKQEAKDLRDELDIAWKNNEQY